MSGTSLDGIDAALVDFSTGHAQLLDFYYQAYAAELKLKIQSISLADQPILLRDYGQLDSQLGLLFAQAVTKLLANNQLASNAIKAIGSHGQTVYHAPEGNYGFSLQIGNPNHIAELTGITTITDFRRRDIVLGGQGAPLVPAFHQAMFADDKQTRVIVNIGGIANISILDKGQVFGFDTGPGNALLDGWCQLHTGQDYDKNGAWAACGKIHHALLSALLSDDYFQLAPPKSTGKEYFSFAWLNKTLKDFSSLSPEDVQASLCALTVESISQSISSYAPDSELTLVCGGGAHNTCLMQGLAEKLDHPLQSTLTFGIHPDHVEAMAFAWLARQTLNQQAGNLPQVTGATKAAILGGIYTGK